MRSKDGRSASVRTVQAPKLCIRSPPPVFHHRETELRFDTVAYGLGNWYLYNNDPAKAQEYFRRVAKGHVWVTWGFIGSELELAHAKH